MWLDHENLLGEYYWGGLLKFNRARHAEREKRGGGGGGLKCWTMNLSFVFRVPVFIQPGKRYVSVPAYTAKKFCKITGILSYISFPRQEGNCHEKLTVMIVKKVSKEVLLKVPGIRFVVWLTLILPEKDSDFF